MSKGAETRAAILDEALSRASVHGLGGVTIGELAKRAGLSKSGLFAHFKSKEQLDIAVLDEARDRFVAGVIAPAFRAPRGLPRIRALFQRWLEWDAAGFQPGGCLFMAAAMELDDQPGPARDHLVATQRDWIEALQQAARIAVEEGHFRADLDVEQWAYELWGLALGYHFYHRLLRDPRALARAERALEALLASSAA
ncbi:MAG: TetR/AcrR family transcriptional regulator [Sandaracinaceae bacterium]|nr:TetR/AcrR family transcriptional regulator [Sandaracinaceae bacterium]